MLATGAILANEIWIGNVHPLAPDRLAESVTCAVPVNSAGLALWSRKPFEPNVARESDGPLTYRFDETDAMVVCDNVEVPWERVFVHNDVGLSRAIYFETPAHCFGNHQSNVRFHAKLRLLVGLASKLTQASGADGIPSVMETLGRLASLEALLAGVIAGQISMAEDWPTGYHDLQSANDVCRIELVHRKITRRLSIVCATSVVAACFRSRLMPQSWMTRGCVRSSKPTG